MTKPLERFARLLLHRSRWLALGFHSRDLASSRFTTVFPGYLTPAEDPALVNAMGWVLQNQVIPGSVLSHSTAALLLGVPMPLALDDGVDALRAGAHVGPDGLERIPSLLPGASLDDGARLPLLHARVERGGTSGVSRGAVVHRMQPGPTVTRGELTLSAPSEVLREIATMIPLWDLVAAVDGVLGPELKHLGETPATLAAALTEVKGLHGTPRALEALRLARRGVRSPGETIFRLLLVRAGLPEPAINLPVLDPLTGRRREIDLAWEEIGLGLEYDGDGHRLAKGAWRADEQRRDELASQGWTLSRANGGDLFRPTRILLRLRRTLSERGVQVPDETEIRRVVAEVGELGLTTRIARRQW
ncbi:hypothetical protein V1260_07090 [Brachybacterium sp. J144]|uniref:hypothetical protein n=1 Tax=Brachybacterium sp. J144 TaxID=3116487 RepID=UPI002E78FA4A|nr:hypothetical protein [Brachybacterium sp. J144]MEE1650555.1 hypothetical protein [Brachybacterium sp. J144]